MNTFIKSLTFLAILLQMNTTSASVAFEVTGQLNLLEQNSNISLQTKYGTLVVTDAPKDLLTCKRGTFLVVNNYHPDQTYSLLEVLTCEEEEMKEVEKVKVSKTSNLFCNKNLDQVCARVRVKCPKGAMCQSVIGQVITFGNSCEMKMANADFIHKGTCHPDYLQF